ncbi:MAG TPA: ester cyclase [Tepidisphaeraceae bacterium]|nr:ester cyclase [Tepidisphaeraceae bacterium]
MNKPQPKQVIQRFVEEALNQHNLNVLDEIVTENFIEHFPFPGQGPGREGLRDVLRAFLAAFPDMRWRIEEQIGEGETVVTRFNFSATHRGEFLGVPASGKAVNVWGVVIDLVRDGRMAESRIIMDMVSMLKQMGAM